jgi:Rap1a immunity proteins
MIVLAILASSVFVTGNELLADCTGDIVAQHRCLAYITGAADGSNMTQVALENEFLCIPSTVSRAQMKDIVVRYLVDHPDKRHLNAGGITMIALKDAFACEK